MRHIDKHPVLEQKLYMGASEIPNFIKELQDEIRKTKVLVTKRLHSVIDISGADCIEDPDSVISYMKELNAESHSNNDKTDAFYKKLNILLDSNDESEDLSKAESLVSDYNSISDDYDAVRSILQETMDIFIAEREVGNIRNNISYLLKEYNPKTINLG